MSRANKLEAEFVDVIPSKLEIGKLYISKKYRTAAHLCCCGCGLEVVTPLNPAKWRLSEHLDGVSLFPSIGNWSFPCRSHYWIDRSEVWWSGQMSSAQIAKVKRRDKLAVQTDAQASPQDCGKSGKKRRFRRLLDFLSHRGDGLD